MTEKIMHKPLAGDIGGDVALVIWRMRRAIAFMSLVGFLLGILFAALSQPTYRASATLYLTEDEISGGILGQLSSLSSAPPAEAEMEVLRSRGIMEDAFYAASLVGVDLKVSLDDLDLFHPGRILWRVLSRSEVPQSKFQVSVHSWPDNGQSHTLLVTVGPDWIALKEPGLWGYSWGTQGDRQAFSSGQEIIWHDIQFSITASSPVTRERHLLLKFLPRMAAIQDMNQRVSVQEVAHGSGVVRLDFEDTDPGRAATITNWIVEAYITRSRNRTAKHAGKTIQYVEEQIERVSGDLLKAESALVKFRSETGAISLTDEALALIDKSSDLELGRVQLGYRIEEQELALKWTRENRDSGMASLSSAPEGALDPVALAILESLGKAQAQRTELATEWTEEAPVMLALKSQIEALSTRFVHHLEGRLEGERQRLKSTDAILAEYKSRLAGLPETERELAQLMRRAKSLEGIYTFLLTQLEEARIAEASAIAAVEVIDRALAPEKRYRPRLSFSGAIGFLCGFMFSLLFAFLRSTRGLMVASIAGLEAFSGLTVFAAIPNFRHGKARSKGSKAANFLALRDATDSPASHSYRTLRAAIKFASKGRAMKTITVTSSGQGEGKSSTILNLGLSLAQAGSSVLIVDADIRRPVVHKYFGLPQSPGLSEILNEKGAWLAAVRDSDQENLKIITAGQAADRPGELLASAQMGDLVRESREHFDYVLFDVPPVLAVADATGFLAELDAIFMLCKANAVPGAVIESATHRLRLGGGKLFGAILNSVKSSRFSRSYSGYGYGYGYGQAKSD